MRNPLTAPKLKKDDYSPFFYFLLISSLFLFTFCGKSDTPGPKIQENLGAVLMASGSPDFGSQLMGSSTEREFTVTNLGKQTATEMMGGFYLSITFSYKGGAFPGIGGTCGSSLQPGSSCKVIVVYEPKFAGSHESQLEIKYFDGSLQQIYNSFTLKGTGV
jgi:hypothetical protein